MRYYDAPIIPYGPDSCARYGTGVHDVSDPRETFTHGWLVRYKEQIYNVKGEERARRIYKELRQHGVSKDVMRQAVKQLVAFTPGFFPRKRGEYNEKAEDLHKVPFFTEAYLYALMGKEEARTVLSLLRRLGETVGLADLDWHRFCNTAQEQEASTD